MRFLDNKMYLDSIKKVALNNQVNFDKSTFFLIK